MGNVKAYFINGPLDGASKMLPYDGLNTEHRVAVYNGGMAFSEVIYDLNHRIATLERDIYIYLCRERKPSPAERVRVARDELNAAIDAL